MKIAPTILYEDENLLVVNKPAGVTVNRAETVTGETVQDWVEEYCGPFDYKTDSEENKVFMQRSGIAHRLDKETSGCLLIAKNPVVLTKLLAQFKNREIGKEYLALVHGKLQPKEGTMRLPIRRDGKNRQKWQVGYDGKIAETAWKVSEYYLGFEQSISGEILTLVRLFPKTGRTHQIRVHMLHLGHPLVGDSKYLNPKKLKIDKKFISRHFLHAVSISFSSNSETIKVEAPLTQDLADLASKLVRVNGI